MGGPHFAKCWSITFNVLFLRWICHLLFPSVHVGLPHSTSNFSSGYITFLFFFSHVGPPVFETVYYFHSFSIQITSSHFLHLWVSHIMSYTIPPHMWVCHTVKSFLSGGSATYSYSEYVDPPHIQTLQPSGYSEYFLHVKSSFVYSFHLCGSSTSLKTILLKRYLFVSLPLWQ